MSARTRSKLRSRILAALYRQRGLPSWVRFLARGEARSLGGSPRDAEGVLRGFYREGYLSLDFGFERGHLTPEGIAAAERHTKHAA